MQLLISIMRAKSFLCMPTKQAHSDVLKLETGRNSGVRPHRQKSNPLSRQLSLPIVPSIQRSAAGEEIVRTVRVKIETSAMKIGGLCRAYRVILTQITSYTKL